MKLALVLAIALTACGRLEFAAVEGVDAAATDATDGASSDAPPDEAPAITPRFAQRQTALSTVVTAVATLPEAVASGSALVVITLSQQQPVMTIADSQGNTWESGRQVEQAVTGSKLNSWFACNAGAGPTAITVTASFNNGPIHIAAYEIAGAAAMGCVEQQGQTVNDTALEEQVVTTEGPTAGTQVVVAGFGAWFDELAYTGEAGELVAVTSRPTPPAPMGDSLATVVAARPPGVQTVRVFADHMALFTALVLTIR